MNINSRKFIIFLSLFISINYFFNAWKMNEQLTLCKKKETKLKVNLIIQNFLYLCQFFFCLLAINIQVEQCKIQIALLVIKVIQIFPFVMLLVYLLLYDLFVSCLVNFCVICNQYICSLLLNLFCFAFFIINYVIYHFFCRSSQMLIIQNHLYG
ncbi:transmembrane protein, putative (macronuclear) [Tetrahymena thermophila SB210]|uniref:Transmembrane protein, putative n=1 Tax=Tetrahymena thermophila (strain SB210) TaxID=312017 RepID=W7X9Q2_TETTS|nr:transmembrane protein, putative [Tetrahymena thermophila SB210]EWS73128.1 transmembrane protein, putative [Tetrahymena thermophila SB210]|eukprot:XP_012654315.1 transmembrane protein, putative [Tetrahymena thermophila SB210]